MNGSAPVAILGAVTGFTLAAILPDALTEALAFVALLTALTAATAREGAVLAHFDDEAVRYITAVGFAVGFIASVVLVVAYTVDL